MMRCGKRLLALMLTVGMVLSCISPAVSATAVEPEEHTHENPVLLSAENPSYVPGTACYVQYDLNNDGALSGKDAVELLGRATQPDVYQGEQIDVDGDGDCDTQDAIALLKIALWPEKYGHAGKVHAFSGEPVWQWSADGKAAVAVFKCACGQETSEITALVARNVGKEATCTEAGFVSATASVTFLGTTYSNNKVTEIPATGHTFAAEADCTTPAVCSKCDYVMPASGHNYVKTAEQAADCTHEASETYTCSVCHDSYTVKTGDKVHTYVYDGETLKDGETCIYEQVLKCSQCGAEIPGETVEHHAYKASVTQEPTCQTAGVKTYTCTKCGDSYTESIPATADGHNWQDKGSGNYECANCGATKTVVVAEDNKVAAGDLENGGEVQLSGDVSVTLDEATAGNLTGELTLNVSKLSEAEKEAVDMDAEYKENSTIYSLTMRDENGSVTEFAGEVTVKLPYELQAGDDVDCITVLYVDGEGNVNEINGHYSNGYVIFTTTHFSFYTVTRLTTTQRCELYGHNDKTTNVEATCENGGYTVKYCRRCGRVEKSNLVDALGHDYRITESQATCTAAGSMIKKCSRCDSTVPETYPALGHSWSVETVEATCTAPGSETKTCETCGEKQTTILPQKAHEITDTVTAPTCVERGYTTHTCANCDYAVVDNITEALGHQYVDTWSWDKSNYSATVTLKCAVCEDTVTSDAAVTEIVSPATCGVAGSEVFEANYSYAGRIFTDSVSEELGALDHDFGPWEADGSVHTRVCANCGTKETAYHAWNQGEMTKEPTCSQEGLRVYTCLECGAQENEVVAVTGEHNLENGVCTDCGFRVDECTHENLRLIEQEIRCGNCVHTLSYLLCECGQVTEIFELFSENEETQLQYYEGTITQKDANTLEGTWGYTCPDCGIRMAYSVVFTADEGEECVGTKRLTCVITGDGVEQIDLVSEQSGVEHPYTKLAAQYDLAKYGFCGGVVNVVTCTCGREGTLDIVPQCEMGFRADEETETEIYFCPECEHSYTVSFSPEGEPQNCIQKVIETVRFLDADGTEVLTLQQPMYWPMHEQARYEFEMLGDSCEDGYYVITHCDACGKEEKDEWLHYDHEPFYSPIDISGHNLCTDTIEHYACPCGQEQWTNLGDDCGHAFDWEYDNETGIETAVCADCGLTFTIDREILGENGCDLDVLAHYVLALPDGTELARWDEERTEGNHDFIALSIQPLTNDGCLGQVEVTWRCTKCGFEETWTEDGSWTDENGNVEHRTFPVERINLGELGLCDGELEFRRCACGETQHIDDGRVGCRMEGGMGDEGWWMEECAVCGSQWKHTQDHPEPDDCYVDGTEGLTITNGDGEEVLSRQWPATFSFHDYIHSFELFGDTCADGGWIIGTCQKCGETSQWPIDTQRHVPYLIGQFSTPEGVCDGTIYETSCPCREEGSVETGNLSCDWVDISRETLGENEWRETGRCSQCGATYEIYGVDDAQVEGCTHTHIRVYTYSDAEGNVFFVTKLKQSEGQHTFVRTAQLHGETCDDGYTVTETCKECNETNTWESSGHDPYLIEQDPIDLADHGFCGGILHITSCPCGQVQEAHFEHTENSCFWEWDDETTTEKDDGTGCITVVERHCEKCHATCTETRDITYTDGCNADVVEETVYRNADGQEIITRQTYGTTMHDTQETSVLLGETCEDGVFIQETCQRCGEVLNERTVYGHWSSIVETIDLSGLSCGGTYTCWECPCGKIKENDCRENCQWEDAGYDEPTGMSLFTCSVCGAQKAISVQDSVADGCSWTSQEHVILTNGQGDVVLDRVFEYAGESHDYAVVSAEAVDGNCDNGYTAELECSKCGKTTTVSGNWHRTFRTQTDLEPLGTCAGTYMVEEVCPCGQQSNTHLEAYGCNFDYNESEMQTNDDGTVTWTITRTCRECGLQQTETCTGTRNEQNCDIEGTQHRVITLNGQVLGEETQRYVGTRHESFHYEYPEGASCTDGVTYRQVCDHCGVVWNEGTVYAHDTFITEQEIDLGQYGAKCGGKLTVYRCLCGAQQTIMLEGSDYCDFDMQECELWVTDAVASHDVFDPEHGDWNYRESRAYDMICAVSDPEPCGFRIRVADYWVQSPDNPCLLQNLQTWRIGYDPDTDTWQKEITVTVNTICDHNMTATNESTTNDQGQRVETDTWVCADCGTTTTRECIYENGSLIRSSVDLANEVNCGNCDRYTTRTEEYILHGDHTHPTYIYYYAVLQGSYEKVYDMRSYEYDFDNCTVHETYEASAGNHWEETRDCHCWDNEFLVIHSPACTQPGKYQNAVCTNCNQQDTYDTYPTGHNWYYNSETGMYYCNTCGLQSATGADGDIVLENLTETYGMNETFTVGYWNKTEIPVTYYVVLVLHNAPEGTDANQVLGGIPFVQLDRDREGVTAIAFDIAETLRLAGQLVQDLNYTGGYDIRFAFVPDNGDTTLDYAITLASVAA